MKKVKAKNRTKFFKELKKICLQHEVITVGYLTYREGQALGFQFDEGSYFLSGSRTGNKFQMVVESPNVGVKI